MMAVLVVQSEGEEERSPTVGFSRCMSRAVSGTEQIWPK